MITRCSETIVHLDGRGGEIATGLRYTPKRRGKFIFRKAFQTVIILNAVLQSNSQLKITGAERGTRTPTTSRSSDFESDVSTNFTTSA